MTENRSEGETSRLPPNERLLRISRDLLYTSEMTAIIKALANIQTTNRLILSAILQSLGVPFWRRFKTYDEIEAAIRSLDETWAPIDAVAESIRQRMEMLASEAKEAGDANDAR